MKFGRASQRSDVLESWTCFPEVQRLNFGRASQRSDGLKFGRASQRSDGLNLDMLPRGPMVWNLGRASQRSKDLNFDGLMVWKVLFIPMCVGLLP